MTKPQLICANLENWFCGAFWGPTFCWGSCMGLLLCSIRNGLTCWGDPTNIWSGTGTCCCCLGMNGAALGLSFGGGPGNTWGGRKFCCCLGTKWAALGLSCVLWCWFISLILQIILSTKINLKLKYSNWDVHIELSAYIIYWIIYTFVNIYVWYTLKFLN